MADTAASSESSIPSRSHNTLSAIEAMSIAVPPAPPVEITAMIPAVVNITDEAPTPPVEISVTDTPMSPTPPAAKRKENLAQDELSPEDYEAIFSATYLTYAKTEPIRAVNNKRYSDTRDDDANDDAYAANEVYDDDYVDADDFAYIRRSTPHLSDPPGSVGRVLHGLGVTLAGIEEVTTETRDKVSVLSDEVSLIQNQTTDIEENLSLLRVHSVANQEEIRELKTVINRMSRDLDTLIRTVRQFGRSMGIVNDSTAHAVDDNTA